MNTPNDASSGSVGIGIRKVMLILYYCRYYRCTRRYRSIDILLPLTLKHHSFCIDDGIRNKFEARRIHKIRSNESTTGHGVFIPHYNGCGPHTPKYSEYKEMTARSRQAAFCTLQSHFKDGVLERVVGKDGADVFRF